MQIWKNTILSVKETGPGANSDANFNLKADFPALAVLILNSFSAVPVCPSGYRYAGQDLPFNTSQADPRNAQESSARGGTYYYEEIDRTDFYSCYKMVSDEPTDFVTANAHCMRDEAQLASFESEEEMLRVRDLFQLDFQPKDVEVVAGKQARALPQGIDFLTSAMYFDEVQNWFWLGSSECQEITRVLGMRRYFAREESLSPSIAVSVTQQPR